MMTRPRVLPLLSLAAAALAAAGLGWWLLRPAHGGGAPFVVDTLFDAPDAHAGDGVCGDSFGRCTLRAAIQEANLAPGPNAISFNVTGAVGLTAALPVITGDLTITGPGSDVLSVDGQKLYSLVRIDSSAGSSLSLSGLTLTRGGGQTGGVYVGEDDSATIEDVTITGNAGSAAGGISNDGTLTVVDCEIANNEATDTGTGGLHNRGTATLRRTTISGNTGPSYGAVRNDGTLTIADSSISANSGTYGGIYNTGALMVTGSDIVDHLAGGGLRNEGGSVDVLDSTIAGNTSKDTPRGGGGVDTSGGSLSITRSTIRGNVSNGAHGGGIYASNTAVTVVDTTIQDNHSPVGSGGIYFAAGTTGNTLALTNVTLSGNTTDGSGGALVVAGSSPNVTLVNATVTANTADADENGSGDGGGLYRASGAVTLQNTILAGNAAATAPDCAGEVQSAGHNIVGSVAACSFSGAEGDVVGGDPLLGPLAENGGPTRTHALQAGSPAIDAGTNDGCPATDQRGAPRDGACDIGAFEFNANVPTPTASGTPSTPDTATPTSSIEPPTLTSTLTPTATPSPVPTATPCPDFDGDTLCDAEDPDDDNDGCTDAQELGANEFAGGRRDPRNFWDFFDTPSRSNERDGSITVSDVFRIVLRFGTSGDATIHPLSPPPPAGYHAAFDRSPPADGANVWNARAADGSITVTDILLAIGQFGHSC